MLYQPLSKSDVMGVINGTGVAERIPVLVHFWVSAESFPPQLQPAVQALLDQYPQDVDVVPLNIPAVYDAPADDPSYRWSYRDKTNANRALDNSGFIEDWDSELPKLLADFPSPDYPKLILPAPPGDGRYRLGHWWYFFFERLWSIRSMENALMDFYEYPDAIHALFRKLTDFYKRMLERARAELNIDGIFTSDDLGTQESTFFSIKIFDEFFAPYYKEVIDHAHSLGMDFWLHACGNIESLLPRLIELGVDVIHPIQKYTMDERRVAARFGDKITIWAGFDVQKTIPFGTPDEVRAEVRYLMDTYARPDGRFMFTLGNGATGDTPIKSLEALLDEAFNYGRKVVSKWR